MKARRIRTTRPKIQNWRLAKRIAAALFQEGGTGRVAQRLVLEMPGEQHGGSGWGQGPARDRIAEILDEEREP